MFEYIIHSGQSSGDKFEDIDQINIKKTPSHGIVFICTSFKTFRNQNQLNFNCTTHTYVIVYDKRVKRSLLSIITFMVNRFAQIESVIDNRIKRECPCPSFNTTFIYSRYRSNIYN